VTNWIYRADITAYNGTTITLHYATVGYATTSAHPTFPNQLFGDELSQPLLISYSMFGEQRTHGILSAQDIGHGEMVLRNSDGSLDDLVTYSFDGRLVELYRVDPADLNTDHLMWRGVIEDVYPDNDNIQVLVRDITYLFDRALQPTKFAGTNSAPNGLEGTASDIKSQPKPKLYGTVYNVSPIPVNTVRFIYQLHDTSFAAGFTLTVYDKRATVAAGISRTLADFQNGAASATVSSIDTTLDQITTTAAHGFTTGDPVHVDATTTLPGGVLNTQYYYARAISTTVLSLHDTAAHASANTNKIDITSAGSGTITVAKNRTPYGSYDWCNDAAGGFLMRFGLQPIFPTCDACNGTTGTDDTCLAVFSSVVARAQAQYPDIGALSLTCENKTGDWIDASTAKVGVYWTEENTIYNALAEVAAAVGASFRSHPASSTNQIVLTQFLTSDGLGSNTLYLDDSNVGKGSVHLVRPQDDERGIPPRAFNCNYKRNYTLMKPADMASVSASDLAFLQREYRTISLDESAIVLDDYPASPELTADTALAASADASNMAVHMAFVMGIGFRMFEVTADLEEVASFSESVPLATPWLVLGVTNISLTNSRFNLSSGQLFGAVGMVLDFAAKTADLTLWG
jgi:hypothetical protein